jgi:dienelactone hydrolase
MPFKHRPQRHLILVLILSLGFLAALPLSRLSAQGLIEPEIVTIALPAHDGYGAVAMKALLYKPAGKGPFQTVLYSHGRAGKPEERADLKAPINPLHAKFWLERDVAILAPIRPGYGITGGEDRENSGVLLNANYECGGAPNVERAAAQSVFAVRTALDWLRQQDFVKKNRILLEGQSVGGMTTVVLGGQNPPGVVGFINFVGGAAGFPIQRPARSCATDQLEALYRKAGQTTRLPNLWLYAVNDQFWGSEAPRLWHKAFAKGGSRTKFIQTGPVENADGHFLLSRGQALWSEPVLSFLADLNF